MQELLFPRIFVFSFIPLYQYNCISLQEIVQSAETTLNEIEVIISNFPPPLVWTYQKKKKYNCIKPHTF